MKAKNARQSLSRRDKSESPYQELKRTRGWWCESVKPWQPHDIILLLREGFDGVAKVLRELRLPLVAAAILCSGVTSNSLEHLLSWLLHLELQFHAAK